jgi:transposase InsO family protein
LTASDDDTFSYRGYRFPPAISQFTSAPFTRLLSDNLIRISMDGRSSWRDNVFLERLWRSVKYEEVYLRAYDSVAEARSLIGNYLAFYNPSGHTRALTAARRTRPISVA